jgi:hypothetical protein
VERTAQNVIAVNKHKGGVLNPPLQSFSILFYILYC